MWMVRAGEDGFLFEEFKNKQLIAIGWVDLGDLSKATPTSDLKKMVRQARPERKEGYFAIAASQIHRFLFEFKKGDKVVTYNPEERKYLVGEIVSDYEYNKELCEYPNIRRVKWLGEVPRDKLSVSTKNTLGAISTIFEVSGDEEAEIETLLKGKTIEVLQGASTGAEAETDLDEIREDMRKRAHEFIKDAASALSWDEMQNLVAGILRAIGYKTRVSPKGPDRGKDVIASPDGLGLQEPRIIVQVKHREGSQIGAEDIGRLIGMLRAGHKGIFVSTGGFTREAKYEAERSHVPLTIIDLDELVNLIIQYYDHFDSETRALIPLTKIYWPE